MFLCNKMSSNCYALIQTRDNQSMTFLLQIFNDTLYAEKQRKPGMLCLIFVMSINILLSLALKPVVNVNRQYNVWLFSRCQSLKCKISLNTWMSAGT